MQSIQTFSPLDQADLQEAARLQGFWTPKGYVGMLMRKIGLSILGSSHMAQLQRLIGSFQATHMQQGIQVSTEAAVIPAF